MSHTQQPLVRRRHVDLCRVASAACCRVVSAVCCRVPSRV
ncbi:putative leader peptide [Streptomyces jeddahensis]